AGLIQIFFATYIVLAHALRGAGDTRASMAITAFTTFVVRLPAAYLLGVTLEMGLTGVWIGLCGELAIRGVLFAIRFLRGRWVDVKV
ncbi:MAG: MATE family efflux transporter, partial [Phycisphaeraceae bacterium]|nr:MATE family efflux transporter [Phycisphaeraceae bacterium]